MGIADFLAQAGDRTAIGQVAQAFGGRTSRQQAVDDFTNNQLPALMQEISANTDENKVRPLGMKFLGAAVKAGMPLAGAEKLMEMTIGPALQGIRQEGLNKLFDQYKGQPAVPGESRPQGTEGPLTPQGNFIDPKAATPDKPLDLNFISKFGQLTGANPQQFNQMLSTPVENAGKELGNKKTQQAIDQENNAQEAIKGLPNIPGAEGQPSQQTVARINRPGITQFLDTRAKPEDPLLEERRGLITAQTGAANAQAGAAAARAGAAGREGRGSAMMQDFIKVGGDPNDREGFLKFADTYRGAGKPNETEANLDWKDPVDRERDIQIVATKAKSQGKTTAEGIKAIAASRGLVIEGTPEITMEGAGVFSSGTPTLGGNYTIRRGSKVTTKTKTGGQGGYSQGPSGSGSGGAGSGGSKPQRMKFDSQGNLVK